MNKKISLIGKKVFFDYPFKALKYLNLILSENHTKDLNSIYTYKKQSKRVIKNENKTNNNPNG